MNPAADADTTLIQWDRDKKQQHQEPENQSMT